MIVNLKNNLLKCKIILLNPFRNFAEKSNKGKSVIPRITQSNSKFDTNGTFFKNEKSELKEKIGHLKNKNDTKKEEIKKSHSYYKNSHDITKEEKSLENYSMEDFIKLFEKTMPLSFNKKSIIQSDLNLSCFIPFSDIINKPKATSLAKQFLEDLISYLNTPNENIFDKEIYEENLIQRIKLNLEKILIFNSDPNSVIKYKIYFKPVEEKSPTPFKPTFKIHTPEFIPKKLMFNINLYNIKNYISLGLEPDRKKIKNSKFLSHFQDMFMENPLSKNEENSTIKIDVITLRETSKFILKDYDSVPLCVLSQFQYTFLPLTEKNNIVIVLELKDELNEKFKKFEFELNAVDFLTECVFFNMTYGDIIKLDKEKKKEEGENILDLDENNEKEKLWGNKERDEYDNMNMQKELHIMLNYLSREKIGISNSKFKIIDVNNVMDGNKLI